jgi:hypothetical protein
MSTIGSLTSALAGMLTSKRRLIPSAAQLAAAANAR